MLRMAPSLRPFCHLVLVLALALMLPSAPALALDAAEAADISVQIAAGDAAGAEAKLLAALEATARGQEREDILALLAEIAETAGRHKDAASHWLEIARLRAERLGPAAPERAAALETAGDLLWAAGDTACLL